MAVKQKEAVTDGKSFSMNRKKYGKISFIYTTVYLLGHNLSMLITVSACRTDGQS